MNEQTGTDQAQFVVAPPAPVALAVVGTDKLFAVRRIYCVGRNYAAHAVEMGHDPDKEPPFFFQKNPDNILPEGEGFPYPSQSTDVHFEVELVIALKTGGSDITQDQALDTIFGYGVGLDMTRRDLQSEAKDLRRPWEAGKAFDHSAPCGPIVPAAECGHLGQGAIWVDVNGERRQTGDLNQMIWKPSQIIAHLSSLFTLAPGDLIYTGTPSGVGAITRGDEMMCHIDGLPDLTVSVI